MSKIQPWDIPGFEIPETREEWEDLVARAKLRKLTINTLPAEMFQSASHATPKQFTMLRIYAPELQNRERFVEAREKFGLPKWAFERATDILRKSPEWLNFLQVVKTDTPIDSIGEDNKIWPGGNQTPTSKRLRTRQGAKKPLETLKDLPDAEDEATPNAALVILVQCITGLVTGLPIEWALNRVSFTPMFGKGGYNTVTDGVLRARKTLATLSILEVKKRIRSKRTPPIIMQEGCELVGWLKESSHRLPDFNNHLLLVSQDRHEIFLTFAAYTRAYKGYLGGEEAKDNTFLAMKTFGPWRTCDHAQMNELGHIVLAIILVAKSAA